MSEPIEEYLDRLNQELTRCFWIGRRQRRRILSEAEDHLVESSHQEAAGSTEAQQQSAVARFGLSHEIVGAFAETTKQRFLALLSVASCGLAASTILMSAGVVYHTVTVGTLTDPLHVIAIRLLSAGFIVVQGAMTVVHLISGAWRERTLFLGAIALLALGMFIAAQGSYHALTGPDPEYWVVMLGLLMTAQATGTMIRVGQWEWRRSLVSPPTESTA